MYSLKRTIKASLEEQWFFLFLLFLITIYPLFNVGLITGDDFNFFIDSKPLFNESGFKMATINGRFYYIFMKWIYSLPYIVDSPVYFGFMHLFPIFTTMFLFVWLVDRVLSDRKFTLLAALFASLFYQVTPWHSMTASHPFYYTFSLSLMLVSFHLIYSYFKNAKYYYLLIASVIFAIVTLFYESYLMFYIVIFILIVSRYKVKTIFAKENIKRLVLELAPFFIFGLLYIGAYFTFIHYYPSRYPGSTFSSKLTFHDFFKCIRRLNKHAIPPNTFYGYKEGIFPTQTEFIKGFVNTSYILALKDVGILSWLKGLVAIYFYALLFFKFSTRLSYKRLLYTVLIGLVIMCVPHIPLALTVQFTHIFFSAWVTTGMSFLGMLLIFVSVIFALNKLISFNKIFRKTINIFLLILLFFITVFVQEANTGITNDLKRSKLRINAVDGLLDSYEIKTGEIYYLQNLYKNTSILANRAVPPDFWKNYFERKKGIVVSAYENYEKLYNDYSEKDTTIHLVFFEQSDQGNDMILSIVKCQGILLTPQIEEIKSNIIDVGYYSDNKKFAFSILSESVCNVMVNDGLMQSHNTFHYANIQAHKRKPATYFSITGNNLLYNTLMIKNIPFENVDFITVTK
jgi:hypothetical protein